MSVISINQYKRRGTIPVHIFFDHRRTRSTIAMTTVDNIYSFDVPRTEAVALQQNLAASPGNEARVLAAFVEQWRQS
jgi:hypothetical protein